MKLNFYGHRIEYDGRELGACAPSDPKLGSIKVLYGTFNAYDMEESSRTIPKERFIELMEGILGSARTQREVCEGKRKGTLGLEDDIKKHEDEIRNTEHFLTTLIALIE